ncbi:helix-turn-helix domain-containing protein [Vagococcus xieshaowenii]|uniref:Recombinase family protein n=1 Tax=Vagococcus xieshaowenii TaxID=2562451 RepID=A0AAJ5JMB5_9ENTE|nr:helix-turn-helix domain-containing protein [Vagococcus xieshaowenii]QCA29669.1 recombinase family protein [Vagococcus xieshaowenii]TFZ42944.1 recombinase family protein [Vagococcus xieshaowenii]
MKLFLNSEEKMSEKSTYREYDVLTVEDLSDKSELSKLLIEMQGESFLYVLSFESLRISTAQMSKLFDLLDAAHVELVFLNETTDFSMYLRKICQAEIKSITYRTKKGIDNARTQGVVGGRPKTPKKTQEKIRELYYSRKLSLKQIAEKCNVSIATVYKYSKIS